jgi:hypothetical protein
MRGEVRGACQKKFAGTCLRAPFRVSPAENRKNFFPARAPHLSAQALFEAYISRALVGELQLVGQVAVWGLSV